MIKDEAKEMIKTRKAEKIKEVTKEALEIWKSLPEEIRVRYFPDVEEIKKSPRFHLRLFEPYLDEMKKIDVERHTKVEDKITRKGPVKIPKEDIIAFQVRPKP